MDNPERLDADKLRVMAARVSRSANGATGMSPPVAGRRARAKPRHRDLQRTDAPGLSHSQSPDTLADCQSSVCSGALQCMPLDIPTSHFVAFARLRWCLNFYSSFAKAEAPAQQMVEQVGCPFVSIDVVVSRLPVAGVSRAALDVELAWHDMDHGEDRDQSGLKVLAGTYRRDR